MPDRNEKGQFVNGNKGGPGRPKRATEEEYRDALIDVIPIVAWKRIAKKALQQAERGDPRAREWVSNNVIGTPIQRLQHAGEGGGPIRTIQEVVIGGASTSTGQQTTGTILDEPGAQ